jgi:D-glycero-D-manno-heptose 1,7-bisphosphate phosphatase
MKAAFIDRDGVINEDLGYVHRVEDFRVLPGVPSGLRLLQDAGFALVVVTNQAGIARGYYGESEFDRLTTHMRELLERQGVKLAGVYHCPHHPTEGVGALRIDCDCRKPRPGLLLHAAADLGLDMNSCVLIGDKESDLDAGIAAGVATRVLIKSKNAPPTSVVLKADHIANGLREAAKWLTRSGSGRDRI